MLDRFKSDLT